MNKKRRFLLFPIQATEAERKDGDPLLGPILRATGATEIRKNAFKTIKSQIEAIYERYAAQADYGVSLVRSIVDKRAAIIASEGVNYNSTKPAVRKFLKRFFDDTKLEEIGILDIVRICEMEGRCVLVPEFTRDDNAKITILQERHDYKIEKKEDKLQCVYVNEDGEKITLTDEEFVYVRMNSADKDVNISGPLIGTVLTQIDNYERALYDLRANNHFYGYPTPYIETQNWSDSTSVLDRIKTLAWKIGRFIAGPFKMGYAEPSGSAVDALFKEMGLNIKIISAATSVPPHWLGWTDLMSNRATADELEESIILGTKGERVIYKAKIRELINKAMALAVDAGYEEAVNETDEFDIDIPYISLLYLQRLADTWVPMQEKDVISMQKLRNLVPGINPADEEKQIEKEKQTNVERMRKSIGNFRALENHEIKEEDGNGEKGKAAAIYQQGRQTQI